LSRWKKTYDQMVELKLLKPGMDITQSFVSYAL